MLPNPHDPRDMAYASGRSEYSDGRLGTKVCRKESEALTRLPDTLAFALVRNIWTERGDQAKKEIKYAFRSSNSIRKQYFFEMREDKKRALNGNSITKYRFFRMGQHHGKAVNEGYYTALVRERAQKGRQQRSKRRKW